MLVDSIVVTRQRYVPERSISEQIKCAASTMKQSLFTTAKETGHGFLAELNWGDPTEWISGNASATAEMWFARIAVRPSPFELL